MERQKRIRGDGKVNTRSGVEANRDMKEESTKLGDVAQDGPLLLYLLHCRAGLQTSMVFAYHLLLTRISPPITIFTRTKDSIYFDEEIICFVRGFSGRSFTLYITPLLLLPQMMLSESCQHASPARKRSIIHGRLSELTESSEIQIRTKHTEN